jgi:alanyl-tRNA synthetase
MKTTQAIRQSFLDYFKQRDHLIMPSGSLIPPEDPTLMFTNAGMVPFKDVFLGKEVPPAPAVTTIQKCLRISGKHNDFDEVGFTNRHCTFFEMMGNFSFGTYFKEEAIAYAWEYLTKVCGLDQARMFATVHLSDDESAKIWHKKIGVPESRIRRFDEDNFWQMADTGPCGPCTEIHYDLGEDFGTVGGDNIIGGHGNRFVEIWNLVFMQFQKFKDGSQENLKAPCVDTGLGLERLAMVMQGVDSNFGTEEVMRITHEVEKITGISKTPKNQVNFHVISDHVRSLLFLLDENILPSNEGRGYVLRRIMRRALRFAGELGDFPNMLSSLLPEVASIYKTPYPGIDQRLDEYVAHVKTEEDKFFDVVKRGSRFLDDEIQKIKKENSTQIPGDVAFKLHDTYGFPIDLTRVIGKQHNLKIDESGFEKNLDHQKNISRKQDSQDNSFEKVRQSLKQIEELPETDFKGYETLKIEATVLHKIKFESQSILIFDQTPFYPTGGGQIGDVGFVQDLDGGKTAVVTGVERLTSSHIGHAVSHDAFDPDVGSRVSLQVDKEKRTDTMAHHTATHLMHKALQVVLGSHVKQQGSYVGPDQLRFDFSHAQKMSVAEKQKVSDWVNIRIAQKLPVSAKVTSIEEARKSGAMMFFGEKYGSEVRQLCVGDFKQPESLELCGGTHVANTSEIGGFEILSEQSIAQGIRRIVALSATPLIEELKKRAQATDDIARLLQSSPSEVSDAVKRLQEQHMAQRKALEGILGELIKAWQVKVKSESQEKCHLFELPEIELPKKAIKQLHLLAALPEAVVLVFYGEASQRRFALLFGSQWKPSSKVIFEKWSSGLSLQGGGGGTQFQGACLADVKPEIMKKELINLLK